MKQESRTVVSEPTADKKNITIKNEFPVDDILVEIGNFGRYQVLVAITIGIALLIANAAQYNFVLTANIPDHR